MKSHLVFRKIVVGNEYKAWILEIRFYRLDLNVLFASFVVGLRMKDKGQKMKDKVGYDELRICQLRITNKEPFSF